MLDLGFRRALLLSALALTTTFATGAARAQEAPPAPAAAPTPSAALPLPGAGYSPSYGYGAPPSYASPTASMDVEYPPEMRQRSTGMVAGGVVLMSFGLVGLLAGSAMVGAHEPKKDVINNSGCFDCGGIEDTTVSQVVILKPGFKEAGIATLIGSGVAMGAGITLLVIGAKKVPYDDGVARATKAALVIPSFRVGATGATFRVQF